MHPPLAAHRQTHLNSSLSKTEETATLEVYAVCGIKISQQCLIWK